MVSKDILNDAKKGIKWTLAGVAALTLVSLFVPEKKPPSDSDLINIDNPLGQRVIELNEFVRSRYGIDDLTILLASPDGDREGLYTEMGREYTDKARDSKLFSRISHEELGQSQVTSSYGHKICVIWAGHHGDYNLLLDRLLATSPIRSGSLSLTSNPIAAHFSAFHELGHCIRPASNFAQYVLDDDELKQKIRSVIDVRDEILDQYFVVEGMPFHKRHLGEVHADLFGAESLIHQANYKANTALTYVLRSRNSRHVPGHFEYASSQAIVSSLLLKREEGKLHPILAMDNLLQKDPLLGLDKKIIGSIADKFKGDFSVIDGPEFKDALKTYALASYSWDDWQRIFANATK